MYQRTYPQAESIPPNYKGNAFDLRSADESKTECEECVKCDKCKNKNDPLKKEEASAFSSLFSRRDGSSFALDDIILGGLIILLLNNHADDELLLVLVLLFISGI